MTTKNTSDEGNEVFVDPNTDDLEQFEQLMNGSAKPKDADDEPEETPDGSQEENLEEDTVEEEQDDSEELSEEDEDDDTTSQEEDDEVEKPKSRFQQRIDEMREKQRLAEERAQRLEQKLEETLARLDKDKTEEKSEETVQTSELKAPDPEAKDENGKPLYPDGRYDDQYIADLTKYNFEKTQQEYEAKQAKAEEQKQAEEQARKIQEQQQEMLSNWERRLDEAEKTMPNLREKSASLEPILRGVEQDYANFLATSVMTNEKGPEILNYLSENPEAAEAIINSGPIGAAMAIGKLEAQFTTNSSTPSEPKRKVSSAPKPPPTNRGKSGKFEVTPDTDDLEAFEKAFFN